MAAGARTNEITVAYPSIVLPFYFKRETDNSDNQGPNINLGTIKVKFQWYSRNQEHTLTDQTIYIHSSSIITIKWDYINNSTSPVFARGEFGPCANMNH
ncbi:hypothetical protein CO731_04833 [Aminobacter sp. MSH1]|nr:hypothetical protein CO731_04833 [Aminobacter sp. MSH1]